MNPRLISSILSATLLFCITHALNADYSVLSGRIFGTEAEVQLPNHGCYNTPKSLGYDLITPLTVTKTGKYMAASANWDIGLDVYFAIYNGAFDPENPALNRIAAQDLDSWWWDLPVQVQLQEGVEYQLVTSPWCTPEKGTWTIVFNGPGKVSAAETVTGLDEFQYGNSGNDAPVADIGCGAGKYQTSAPQHVSHDMTVYLVDISYFFGDSACVGVYTAPFDPSQPEENRVEFLFGYYAKVDLNAGQDYYFVSTPNGQGQKGEYFYLVLPTGDIYFDPVLSGSWLDPITPNQGFFLDVLGHDNQAFLGWFTFDLNRPAPDTVAYMGDSGHRWLTAYGKFSEVEAEMDIEVSSGGVFDESEPAPEQRLDGHLTLRLFDCHSGEIDYDLGTAGRAGTVPIQRISTYSAGPCEALMNRPGKPRPLMAE